MCRTPPGLPASRPLLLVVCALLFVVVGPVRTLAQVNPAAPTITSAVSFSVDEGETAITTLTAADDDTDAADLSWSITGGDDSGKFSLTATGALNFTTAKDYEQPDDADSDGTYEVTVQVSDGSLADSVDLTITIANVDEVGTLTLGPGQPRVGVVSRARLSDPDGVTFRSWRWQRSSDGNDWTSISGASTESYQAVDADAGMYLRATARYSDGHGSGKSLQLAFSDPVAAREASPGITVVTLVSGLTIPWDLAFAPDETMLFTERSGVLSSMAADGTVQTVTADFSDLYVAGEAGLMAIVVDPDFSTNSRFYTCQSTSSSTAEVIAWTIDASYATATRAADPLVGNIPAAFRHSGCRLRFGPSGYLWIATGDAAVGTHPQNLDSLGGKILRVDATTGAAAPDNPFASRVFSYGHRNVQGLALRPGTSQMWIVEHGPTVDDEINLLVSGGNYGWDPVPSYNEAVPMTDLVKYPSAIEAKWSSGFPTLATSGGIFLDGSDWDGWAGRLAVANLKGRSLHLFEFTAEGELVSQVVVSQLDGTHGRLRTPMIDTDGVLYVTTSNGGRRDRILKVVPSLAPEFASSAVTLQLEENSGSGALVGTVEATDPDGEALTYALGGTDAESFTLDQAAALRSAGDFDRETKDSYEVTITATDPYGLSDTVTVTVEVSDRDEPAEISFSAGSGVTANNSALAVDENHTGTLAAFSASDPENKGGLTYTWSLGGTDASDFAITPAGNLSFATPPDYERPADTGSDNVYDITVNVLDSDGLTADLILTVTVRPIDDPPVISGNAAPSIDEESTLKVGTYVATDPENKAGLNYTWSLGGADASDFAITTAGVVSFATTPDYERPADSGRNNVYDITVNALDSDGLTGSKTVTVTVNPVNEAPVITGPASVDFAENRMATVATYMIRDPESDATNWGGFGDTAALTGDDAGAFDFDKTNGRLTFKVPPDYEIQGRYDITLNANDGRSDGNGALDVVVTVANIEESGSLTLGAQRGVNGELLEAMLTDPDIVATQTWKWQRSSSTSGPWTDITNNNGSHYTPGPDDVNQYIRAHVTYTDGSGTEQATLTASTSYPTVNDSSANQPPASPDPLPQIDDVPENAAAGRKVARIVFTDPEGERLTYSLDSDEFAIHARTGQITVKQGAEFDYETTTSYEVHVAAADPFGAEATATLTIGISDVNEAPEAADDAPSRFDEDTSITIDVLANDSDPENDDLSVTSVTRPSRGSATLESDGTITYTPNPNYHGSDSFTYRARDTGGLTSNVATIALTIDEVNDAPTFASATVERSVSENAVPGSDVGAPVTAKDVDEGDSLTYSLSGTDAGSFDIDENSGQLMVANGVRFDIDMKDTYNVTVEADDGNGGGATVDVTISVTSRPPFSILGGGGGGGGGGGPPPVPIPSDKDFDWNVTRDIESLDRENDLPTGMWSDGTVLRIVENSATGADRLFAYDLLTGERLDEFEFEFDRRNRFSHGIWSDGKVVWIADSGQDKLFAYDLETGERIGERDVELSERNRDPRGIWSDGKTIWVLDSVKDALFAYDLKTGELLAVYPLDKLNKNPRGIWSDGVNLWVSDDGAKRVFAYRPVESALQRIEDEEFTFRSLLKAGNGDPRGIWSDGDIMYVVDTQDDRVYTYNIPDATIAQLASLSLTNLEIGSFISNQMEYSTTAAPELSMTTVVAKATQEQATLAVVPEDADDNLENGHQVNLETETAVTVTVTSADSSRSKAYRVLVSKPPCLEGLALQRLSQVAFVGGSVDELETCARSLNVDALYHHRDGAWTALFLAEGLPAFLSQPFRTRFAEGLSFGKLLTAVRLGYDGSDFESAEPD